MKHLYNMDFVDLGKYFAKRINLIDDKSRTNEERFYEQWDLYKKFGVFNILKYNDKSLHKESFKNIIDFMYGLGLGSETMGISFPINVHIWATITPMIKYADKSLYDKYIVDLLNGNKIGAHAISESDAGSDVFNIETEYEKKDGGYVLNGKKNFVTNAPYADIYLVYARRKGKKDFNSISCFVVSKKDPGFFVGKSIKKMGMELSPLGSIYMNDCYVDGNCILGREYQGMSIFNYTMMHERIFLFSFQVGFMEHQLKNNISFCKKRKQSGKSIIEYQSVSNRIADMKVNVEACKLFLKHLISCFEKGEDTYLYSSISKLFISEKLVENSILSLKNYGAYGYTCDCLAEEQLRDSIGGLFYSGTSDIQRNIISKLM